MGADRNRERTVLVCGATGKQGGATARKLLERGFRVRAMSRDPDQPEARALEDAGAEPVQADLDDRESLVSAVEGVWGVYSMQEPWGSGGPEQEIEQGRRMADVAEEAGIGHFVYASVGSAHRDTGIPHFDSKWQIEEHVRDSGLSWTILRPVFFMNNWESMRESILEGTLPQPLSPDTRLQQIAVDDIGAFAAMAFSDPEAWRGREVDIAGDEPTMRETAETFGRILDQEVRYVQVPWDDFRQEYGDEMTTMYEWFEKVGYEADIGALRQEHPDLARLGDYLRWRGWGAGVEGRVAAEKVTAS